MEPTANFDTQMDAYLLGQMPEQERAAFELKAEQDPVLAQEMRMQRDIVQGLRQARMVQLKAQLAQVPTPPLAGGAFASLSGWQGIGLAAASVAVLIGGLALYANSETADEKPATPEVVAQAPQGTKQAAQQAATQHAVPQAPAASAGEAKTSLPTYTSTGAFAPKAKTETITSTRSGARLGKYQSFNLSVDLPSIAKNTTADPAYNLTPTPPTEEADDQTTLDKPGLGALPSGKVVEVNEIKSKPEVIIRPSDVLSYQFFDNKLYLYGSFGDAIYEVMELTTNQEGRRLYVFFKDNFYTVSKEIHDVTPMKPIADPRLVSELTLLRKRKVD